jgi:hypothetical protein
MQQNATPMGKCPHCEYSESAAHMICSCPNPAYAKIRKEWQWDMHDTIEKAVPEGLASDLKQLWGTKDGTLHFSLGNPATHLTPTLVGSQLIHSTIGSPRSLIQVLGRSGMGYSAPTGLVRYETAGHSTAKEWHSHAHSPHRSTSTGPRYALRDPAKTKQPKRLNAGCQNQRSRQVHQGELPPPC